MSDDKPVPTEKPKKAADVVFSRPVYSAELLTDEGRKKFDQLPAWQRHLVKRLVDHGDLLRAAKESGATYINKEVDVKAMERLTITEALNNGGLTNDVLAVHILDCLEAKTIKFDKHQNAINCVDMSLKLRTIELIAKLKGLFDEKQEDKTKNNSRVQQLFEDTPV